MPDDGTAKELGLICPVCDAPFFYRSGMYNHLRYDHDLSHEEAYSLAGDAQRAYEEQA